MCQVSSRSRWTSCLISFPHGLCKWYYCPHWGLCSPRLAGPGGVKHLWWELPTRCPLVPGLFCTLWLGSVSGSPLGQGAQHSLSHQQRWGWRTEWTCLGTALATHPPGRRLSMVCFFHVYGAPLLRELTSHRVEGMEYSNGVSKSPTTPPARDDLC